MSATSPQARSLGTFRWKQVSGPLLTVSVMAVLRLVSHGMPRTPGLGVILIATIVYSVVVGGTLSGATSACIAVAFNAYAESLPQAPFHYSHDSLERVFIVTGVAPFIVLTLGHLRLQLDRYLVREHALLAEAEAQRQRAVSILESITDGFFALDDEWRYVYINGEGERLLGRSRAELLGTSVWEAFPSLVGSEWDREYHRAMAQQVVVHFEEYYPPFDAWFETHVYPTKGGLSIYVRNVTERRRAAQALEVHARQQATAAALSSQALSGAPLSSLFDEATRAVAVTLGVQYAKILELLPGGSELIVRAGVGWREGTVGHTRVDAAERSQAGYTLLSRGPTIVEDLQTETRFSGSALLIEHGIRSGISVTIAGANGPFGVLGAHSREKRTFSEDDVHFVQTIANVLSAAIVRKRAEESLLESEQRFRQLAENVQEAFFVADREWARMLYMSPAYELIWGRSRQSLRERPQAWLEAVHPEDRGRMGSMVRRTSRGQELDTELRVTRPGGEVRFVRVHAFPVRSETGAVYRVVGIAEDVTERKAAEDNARRLAAAEAAVRARDEIVAVVSHDLRSPLSSITMSLELLKRPLQEDRRARHLQVIERSVGRMSRLIQDLLDVSKIEAGRFAIEARPLAIGSVLQEACEAARPLAEEKLIQLACDIGAQMPLVSGDRHRLFQALSNLLGNAIKFTSEGGRVVVRAEALQDSLRVSVSDTGPGIAREYLPHLFERFFQVGLADRRGAGLGLAIVKGIVEAHGGVVEVESEPGAGSTFHFTLPALRGDERPRA